MRLKSLDFVAMCLSLLVIGAFIVSALDQTQGEAHVHIEGETGEWLYPLDSETVVQVEGPLGTTIIQVSDGAAKVVSSPCKDKICMTAGAQKRPGDWAACLPNKVFLTITGVPEDDGPDTTSF